MGEDVVMDQVLAFDIRVYDPQARNLRAPTLDTALTPGDPGYESAIIGGARVVGLGAYVDLGYAQPYTITNNAPVFVQQCQATFFLAPDPKSIENDAAAVAANEPQILSVWQLPAYDTWTIEYERDGLNQNSGANNLIDEGLNGLDDNATGGVDDIQESDGTSISIPFTRLSGYRSGISKQPTAITPIHCSRLYAGIKLSPMHTIRLQGPWYSFGNSLLV